MVVVLTSFLLAMKKQFSMSTLNDRLGVQGSTKCPVRRKISYRFPGWNKCPVKNNR